MNVRQKQKGKTLSLSNDLAAEIAKGKWRFIVARGLLGYGLTMTVVYNVIMFFAVEGWNALGVEISLILFPLGGAVWGACTWWWIKRRFDRLSSS